MYQSIRSISSWILKIESCISLVKNLLNSLRKHVIDFELKDFAKVFNQKKVTPFVHSSQLAVGKCVWYLVANTERTTLGDFSLGVYLYCQLGSASTPVYVHAKIMLLNQIDPRLNTYTSKFHNILYTFF